MEFSFFLNDVRILFTREVTQKNYPFWHHCAHDTMYPKTFYKCMIRLLHTVTQLLFFPNELFMFSQTGLEILGLVSETFIFHFVLRVVGQTLVLCGLI